MSDPVYRASPDASTMAIGASHLLSLPAPRRFVESGNMGSPVAGMLLGVVVVAVTRAVLLRFLALHDPLLVKRDCVAHLSRRDKPTKPQQCNSEPKCN